MEFTEIQLKEMQHVKSPHWNDSCTFGAMIVMENDFDIIKKIDELRRIDDTVTAQSVQAVFNQFDVQEGLWGWGKPDFSYMAELFNEDRVLLEIPDLIKDTLKTARLFDDRIELTRELDRSDYAKVNKVIEALGGKWKKALKAHVFSGKVAEEVVLSYLETGKIEPVQKFGFFPTPKPLGRFVVNSAKIEPTDLLLEPEAGVGGLAELCAELVSKDQITCYEIQAVNCDILKTKGFHVEQIDFMSVAPVPVYDCVIMNPPFEKSQDIDHVLHAYKFLKPGGRLRAIMSYGTVFRSNKKTTEFRDFLEEMGARIIENEHGDFKDSGTMVKTICVFFEKPIDAVCDFPNATLTNIVIPHVSPETYFDDLPVPALCGALSMLSKTSSVQQNLFDF
jgi:hypothetical protein